VFSPKPTPPVDPKTAIVLHERPVAPLEDAELLRRTILASFHGQALREFGAAAKKAAVPSNMIAAASRTLKVNMIVWESFLLFICLYLP
jgi:hypothetical protein